MGGNIAPGSLAGIAIEPVQRLLQGAGKARKTALHAIKHTAIANQNPHQRRQVIHRPPTLHVGFARADRAAECHVRIKARIVYA